MLGVRVEVPLFFLCHLLYSFLLAPTVVILERMAFLNCGKEMDDDEVKKEKLKSRKVRKRKADSEEKERSKVYFKFFRNKHSFCIYLHKKNYINTWANKSKEQCILHLQELNEIVFYII